MTDLEDNAEEIEREVDYRFILANERTFLAWMRTALGLVAGGVALDQFVAVASTSRLIGLLAIGIIVLGAMVAVVGITMWRRSDAAMFEGRPLPRTRAVPIIGVFFVLLALAVALALTLGA
ncbi:MAG: DUF202 domain-containing protein [Candidatus Nanopelagicales bacterium]|jgi:putative membrane protein